MVFIAIPSLTCIKKQVSALKSAICAAEVSSESLQMFPSQPPWKLAMNQFERNICSVLTKKCFVPCGKYETNGVTEETDKYKQVPGNSGIDKLLREHRTHISISAFFSFQIISENGRLNYFFDNEHLSILLEGEKKNLIKKTKPQSLLNISKGITLEVIYLDFQQTLISPLAQWSS